MFDLLLFACVEGFQAIIDWEPECWKEGNVRLVKLLSLLCHMNFYYTNVLTKRTTETTFFLKISAILFVMLRSIKHFISLIEISLFMLFISFIKLQKCNYLPSKHLMLYQRWLNVGP